MTAPSYRIEEMAAVPEGRFFVKGQVTSLKIMARQRFSPIARPPHWPWPTSCCTTP